MTRSKAATRWSTLFGFGSVPGSPAEARAFLQRRVALYTGMALGLWGLATLVDAFIRVPRLFLPGKSFFGPILGLEVLCTLLLGGLYLGTRRGERPLGFLHAVDAGGTLVQALLLTFVIGMEAARVRPEFGALLGLAHILVARAAVVPSTPARTAAIAAAAGIPIVSAVAYVYVRDPLPAYLPPFWIPVLGAAVWMLMAGLSSTIISRVIYGLQQQITEALQLGQYRLEEKLGEGGMGVVYRARHALMKRPTAVKVLPPERAGAAAIARFEREVILTSRLTHPNTIAIYDFGRTPEGLFYYAMEYVDGIDLEALVRLAGPLPPGRVLALMLQVASALEEAHDAGLVHRDIKPANLILCERGREGDFVKVLDFGLVKEVAGGEASLSREDTVAGTPLYMAPEAITGRGVDARSDLYALGAVAYFLLTGSPVFEGRTVVEVCARHLHAPVEPPSQRAGVALPARLEALVLACLAKSPADRPASAAALLDALAACDDVPAWTREDARRFWAERGAALRQEARRPHADGARGDSRLRVNLSARADAAS
jgi:serine/threonine-protein kinase